LKNSSLEHVVQTGPTNRHDSVGLTVSIQEQVKGSADGWSYSLKNIEEQDQLLQASSE